MNLGYLTMLQLWYSFKSESAMNGEGKEYRWLRCLLQATSRKARAVGG